MQGAKCKILNICTCVQVPRYYQDLISRSYFYITSYLQGAKCKILHICTRASIKFLSSPNFHIILTCKLQSARYCTFAHVQVLSSYQDPISSSPPTCKVQSAKSCTFTHMQVPKFYQDPISRSYFYITSYLQGAKCKILHICTQASIKFLSRPNFFITPYMQGANCKILHTSRYQDLIKT